MTPANTTGTLAQTYTFDSFGNQTGSSGSLTNPFQYTAREFDPETSLYFYRARYYDPNVGRFLSEDLLGFGAGPSDFYEYAFNSPTNYTDPWGYQAVPVPVPIPVPEPAPIPFWPFPGLGGPVFRYDPWGRLYCDSVDPTCFPRLQPPPSPRPPSPPTNTSPSPDAAKDNPPCKKGKWHCTAKCHMNNFSNIPNAPMFVTGEGEGRKRQGA